MSFRFNAAISVPRALGESWWYTEANIHPHARDHQEDHPYCPTDVNTQGWSRPENYYLWVIAREVPGHAGNGEIFTEYCGKEIYGAHRVLRPVAVLSHDHN